MCLIIIGIEAHPKYGLVIGANRDEFYARPTAPASFWSDAPQILAGRDLREGGTWLGVTRTGRIAAVTNYRNPVSNKEGSPSRGKLVSGYLLGNEHPARYLERLSRVANEYSGFNILAGQREEIYWYSNYGKEIKKLSPGIHGLSNHLMDTPWPKVEKGVDAFGALLAAEEPSLKEMFQFLSDRAAAPDERLPDTGVGLEMERLLSPVFITSPDYGTRSSTVVMMDRSGGILLTERSFSRRAEWTDASFLIQ
jgi:uncharacterized protein with NRDE domain